MLAKRIIPCLDIANGRTVKGINFLGLKDAGDPVALTQKYVDQGADELVFLDITATHENRKTKLEWVKSVGHYCSIPFTVGGGVSEINHVYDLLNAGADKVAINSAAFYNPALIEPCAKRFGRQCIVLAVDGKAVDDQWWVYTRGGRVKTDTKLLDWIIRAEKMGAGEILFTAMNNDGVQQGFANQIIRTISEKVKIPVIASGGAGKMEDFATVFEQGKADAALAASVFHYNQIAIPELKMYLKQQNINVR